MLSTLTTTVLNRPYVLLFLLSYIFIAIRVAGIKWMLSFLILGYTVAFFSEYSSINFGFPYGWYFYKYENLTGEWLNHGVPVWDSVSYVFMCFAGLFAAKFALQKNNSKIKLVILSAFLVTLLDVITDPLAHMGKRWFLGEIYFYPKPGFYFDVPLNNFIGWFLVSLTINAVGIFLLKFDHLVKLNKKNNFLGLGLYYGIFGFGLAITVYLKEWSLVLCDLFWIALSIGTISWTKNQR
jgi:putative membrane protein